MPVAARTGVGERVGTGVKVGRDIDEVDWEEVPGGTGVAVGVVVGPGVAVAVGRGVAVAVAVGGGVAVAVAVGEGVAVAVAVGEGVAVAVAVGMGVAVAVAVGEGVGEGVAVAPAVGDAVGNLIETMAGEGEGVGARPVVEGGAAVETDPGPGRAGASPQAYRRRVSARMMGMRASRRGSHRSGTTRDMLAPKPRYGTALDTLKDWVPEPSHGGPATFRSGASAPNGIRIRVCGLKGRCPGPLDDRGTQV